MDLRRRARLSIVLFGLVSLLADLTYESARGVLGPYLGMLGAGAVAIGIVSGAGELIGYGVRFLSGWVADRTRRYWWLVWFGYAMNVLAVPLLALVRRWEPAAALVVAERLGKAIRAPARDALLSQATHAIGHGKGFGIHEALDQLGALGGPLLMAAALAGGLGYRGALALLLIPAVAALGVLRLAQRMLPPGEPLQEPLPVASSEKLPAQLRPFLLGACCAAAGMVDFPLLAYHLHTTGLTDAAVPLLYAFAMAIDAAAALLLGNLFDRFGLRALAATSLLSSLAAPLIVSKGSALPVLGIAAWGIGMGAHESILRAGVAVLVPAHQRGSAFGMLSAWYGLAWFAGSSLLGIAYHWHPWAMALLAAALHILAALLWFAMAPGTPR